MIRLNYQQCLSLPLLPQVYRAIALFFHLILDCYDLWMSLDCKIQIKFYKYGGFLAHLTILFFSPFDNFIFYLFCIYESSILIIQVAFRLTLPYKYKSVSWLGLSQLRFRVAWVGFPLRRFSQKSPIWLKFVLMSLNVFLLLPAITYPFAEEPAYLGRHWNSQTPINKS